MFATGAGGKNGGNDAIIVGSAGPRSQAHVKMLQDNGIATANSSLQAGHSGKYLGLGNKSGLGGTHRHSLEKLKEYESQLLMSSTAANTNSNAALK